VAAQRSGGGSRKNNSWSIGGVIDDRYELRQLLATGEYSEVYSAVQLNSEDRVAIKCLRADLTDQDALVARMKKEAKLMTRLKHPNIVRLLDAAVAGGRPFLAMELLEGQDLRHLISREGALPIVRAIFIVTRAAFAIEDAHDVGIIHRDLKPENIFVTFANDIKVLDFGAAKFHHGARNTDDARRIGTLPYMAPEVLDGEPANERSDIFALGVILFELLRGRHFFALSPIEWPSENRLYRLMSEWRFPALEELLPDVSDHLRAAIAKAIARDPGDRFTTAEEFRIALEGAMHLELCERLAREMPEHPPSGSSASTTDEVSAVAEPSGPRVSRSEGAQTPASLAMPAKVVAIRGSATNEPLASRVAVNIAPAGRQHAERTGELPPVQSEQLQQENLRSAPTTPYLTPMQRNPETPDADSAPTEVWLPAVQVSNHSRTANNGKPATGDPTRAHTEGRRESNRSPAEQRKHTSDPRRDGGVAPGAAVPRGIAAPKGVASSSASAKDPLRRPSARATPLKPETWSTRLELVKTRQFVRWLAVVLAAVIGVLLVFAVAFAVMFSKHAVARTEATSASAMVGATIPSAPIHSQQGTLSPSSAATTQVPLTPGDATVEFTAPVAPRITSVSPPAFSAPPRTRSRPAPKPNPEWLPQTMDGK
jgi:serine/threonine protein kinase